MTEVSCLVSLVGYDIDKSGTPWVLLVIPVGTSGHYPIFFLDVSEATKMISLSGRTYLKKYYHYYTNYFLLL